VKVKKKTLYRGRVRPRTGIWHLAVWLQGGIQPICHIGDVKWVFWLKMESGTEVDQLGYCKYCLDAGEQMGYLTKK
jgi:hypothetical protein